MLRIFEFLYQFPLWAHDRAVMVPTYPVEERIRSNIVPFLGGKGIGNFDKDMTEADIGRLRISFLRIQVKRSSLQKWGYNAKQIQVK